MAPKPIQYVKGELSAPRVEQHVDNRVQDGDSVKQGRGAPRPVQDRVKQVNPPIHSRHPDAEPKNTGERMIANGRLPLDGGGTKHPGMGEGFHPPERGDSLKRRNGQTDRQQRLSPPIDVDRKRQRNAPWPYRPPPTRGAASMPKHAEHTVHDPEVEVVDPNSPPRSAGTSYARPPHGSSHPVPSRRPPPETKLRSGVMVSRVGPPHGTRYDTEKLSAVQQALSQAEEAFLEAQTAVQARMQQLPLLLKTFLEEQLSCVANACGFTVEFSEPSNSGVGAICANFLPSSAVSGRSKVPEAAVARPPSPRQPKAQSQATAAAAMRREAVEPAPLARPPPARPAQPAYAPPSAEAAAAPAGAPRAIMTRVSLQAPPPDNPGGVPLSSLHERLEHDTAAPVCFRFAKDETRETPERGGETPSEGDERGDEDEAFAGAPRAAAHAPTSRPSGHTPSQRSSAPPRWPPSSAPEDGVALGPVHERAGPGGGRHIGMGRGGRAPNGDVYMHAGKYASSRGSPPPPMGPRNPPNPGRGRERMYASGPGPHDHDAWEQPPPPSRSGGRHHTGGAPRRHEGPPHRGGRGGRGPPHPMDGGDGFRSGDGGRGRGRGRGQYGDLR